MCFSVIGPHRNRAVKTCQRRVEPLQLLQRIAAIDQRLDEFRPRGDGPVVTRQRLVVPLERIERDTAIVQRQNVVGIFLQRQVHVMDRARGIAALMKYEAEQVPAVELIRIDGKDLAIDFFRLGQSPGLVQRQCLRQQRGHLG